MKLLSGSPLPGKRWQRWWKPTSHLADNEDGTMGLELDPDPFLADPDEIG